jgi:uncharacterized protein YdaU (DUF1376 family)
VSVKRENFYRRNPDDALSGMVGMSLEERGVYNTVIDLIYLTWRPLEDSRAYIANHCGCAVQKLNPILARLIEKRKLLRFEEDGVWYLSNKRFEEERTEVKGGGKTRSGRGEVGEKSAGVGQKSAGVEENPPTCNENIEEKPDVTPLEKSRIEQSRITTIISASVPEWQRMLDEAKAAAGDAADLTRTAMHHAADLRALVEPHTGEPCTWAEVLDAIAMTAMRQRAKGKLIQSWKWVEGDAFSLRDKRLNAIAPPVTEFVPLRATGPPSITDKIAVDNAEARRRAFEIMDAQDGR